MDADSEDKMGHSSIQFETIGAHLGTVDALTLAESAQDQEFSSLLHDCLKD